MAMSPSSATASRPSPPLGAQNQDFARVGLDVMSKEKSISELLSGGLDALKAFPTLKLYPIGERAGIERYLKTQSYPQDRLEIIESHSVISSEEDPTVAIRQKKDSSIVVGLKALSEDHLDSFFSSGSTGAVLAAALLLVGRIPGIKRPAIACPMPTNYNQNVSLFLDAGANVDCPPEYLQQFALMGYIYSKYVLKVENPRIGLLNVGEEEKKGNRMSKQSHALLQELPYPFMGNIEPLAFFHHRADVMVCDGFPGNIFLKSSEAIAEQISGIIKTQISATLLSRFAALLLRRSLRKVWSEMSPSQYGGAPLLGLLKPVFIGHGRSDVRSIFNGIRIALLEFESHIHAIIQKELTQLKPPESSIKEDKEAQEENKEAP